MNARRASIGALSTAILAISCAAIFFRLAFPTEPIVAAAIRLSFATLLLSPVILRAWRGGKLPIPVLKKAVLAGFCYALHFGAWVTSLSMTSVAASVTLVTATPLILAVAGQVSGKDVATRRTWVALAIAMGGLGILGGADLLNVGREALIGDGLALVGCAAMAGYMLIARSLGPSLNAWAFSGCACAVGALVLWSCALLFGVSLHVPGPEAWTFLALAAVIPQLIGHGFITWSLRSLRPTTVGLATLAEPIFSTLLAVWILDETPEPMMAVGGAITLVAVAIALTERRPDPEEEAQENREGTA